jgi:methylated-DNA-[protein]-cysteine S-methyltransferase
MLFWTECCVLDDLKLRLVATISGIRGVYFLPAPPIDGEKSESNQFLLAAGQQLREYFAGKRREFQLPLDMQGTDFQLDVWRQLLEIPYGKTRSYAQIAEAIGRPKAVRAVGAANGSNPVSIVVPCHRVIGSSGKLTGYGGGLPLKKRLLELEGAWSMDLAM